MSVGGVRGQSKQAVFAAAIELFAERGYASTSVRDIAKLAGTDPALVIRHFGSKEELFVACMQPDTDGLVPFHSPIGRLGEEIVRTIVAPGSPLRSTFLALVRASEAESVKAVLADLHELGFVRPLAGMLEGEDAELRARLAAAMVGGLMYALWIAGDGSLQAHPDAVVAYYAPKLQQLITP
ncbi:MAG: TetR/AcrR family transcriptional regulator [Candidatus Leucobacter sulfamidivorax]|nr:TetR/AcrR family transcriptional regulator [Candidatus Leucobacter sulfamidivorax]